MVVFIPVIPIIYSNVLSEEVFYTDLVFLTENVLRASDDVVSNDMDTTTT